MKAGSARFASAVSQRTWVVRGSLSNRQMLKGSPTGPTEYQKSCKIRAKVALLGRIRAAQAGRRRPLPCCSSPPTTHPTFKAQRSSSTAGRRHLPPARRSIAARRNFRKITNPISTPRRKIASKLCCSVPSSPGRIFQFCAGSIEPWAGVPRPPEGPGIFDRLCIGEPDMPKAARVSTQFPASTASSEKSQSHPLVSIALFSGIGLLISLIAVLLGVSGVWY
jgi:hypothetical protein